MRTILANGAAFVNPAEAQGIATPVTSSRRLRDECLNTQVVVSLEDAREKLEASRVDYGLFRPHSTIGNLPTSEFARTRLAAFENPEILNLQPVQLLGAGQTTQHLYF